MSPLASAAMVWNGQLGVYAEVAVVFGDGCRDRLSASATTCAMLVHTGQDSRGWQAPDETGLECIHAWP